MQVSKLCRLQWPIGTCGIFSHLSHFHHCNLGFFACSNGSYKFGCQRGMLQIFQLSDQV